VKKLASKPRIPGKPLTDETRFHQTEAVEENPAAESQEAEGDDAKDEAGKSKVSAFKRVAPIVTHAGTFKNPKFITAKHERRQALMKKAAAQRGRIYRISSSSLSTLCTQVASNH
jgi:hypothetical protein